MSIQLQPSCELTLLNKYTCTHSLEKRLVINKRSRSHLQHFTAASEPELKKHRVGAVKTVTFSSIDVILPVRSTSDSNDWNSKADVLRFHTNVKRDIQYLGKLMKERRLADFQRTEYCSVGIERHCCTKETRYKRKDLNNRHFQSVLELQQAQRKMGVSDPDSIRQVAQQHSQESRARAAALATGLWKRP
jgi:hypothetical protein